MTTLYKMQLQGKQDRWRQGLILVSETVGILGYATKDTDNDRLLSNVTINKTGTTNVIETGRPLTQL